MNVPDMRSKGKRDRLIDVKARRDAAITSISTALSISEPASPSFKTQSPDGQYLVSEELYVDWLESVVAALE